MREKERERESEREILHAFIAGDDSMSMCVYCSQ